MGWGLRAQEGIGFGGGPRCSELFVEIVVAFCRVLGFYGLGGVQSSMFIGFRVDVCLFARGVLQVMLSFQIRVCRYDFDSSKYARTSGCQAGPRCNFDNEALGQF